jgi:hypothetical protein
VGWGVLRGSHHIDISIEDACGGTSPPPINILQAG